MWNVTRTLAVLVSGVCLLTVIALAAVPASQPATNPTTVPSGDAANDWLLGQAAVTPGGKSDAPNAIAPAARSLSPFQTESKAGTKSADTRAGTMLLSNGEKIHGRFATTEGKPWRIYDEHQTFRDVPFNLIKSAEAKVLWEREEREWHFKESGSDVKEYSGKTYPDRETTYTLTLANGQTVTGGIVVPIDVQTADGQTIFILHKRDKGEIGQTLKDLIYVLKIEFE